MVMTTDEWVRKLNALGLEMDIIANMVHPTAWADHGMEEMKAEWRKLATADTADQLSLFAAQEVSDD